MKQEKTQDRYVKAMKKLTEACGATGRPILIIARHDENKVAVSLPVSTDDLVSLLKSAFWNHAELREACFEANKSLIEIVHEYLKVTKEKEKASKS